MGYFQRMNIKLKLEFLKKYPLSILWGIFILILCAVRLSSLPPIGKGIEGFDKIVHFTFFLTLSLILVYEDHRQHYSGKSRLRASMGLIALGIVYGGGIELLQKYIFTYRSAEWLDLAADLLGCLVAVALFNLVLFKRKIVY